MNNGIIITTFLPGKIGGSVSHTEKQTIKVDASEVGSKKPLWVSKEITHTDRSEQPCYKKLRVHEKIVQEWISNTVPFWHNKKEWFKMNKNQRLVSYVMRFDEGFGVIFEEV